MGFLAKQAANLAVQHSLAEDGLAAESQRAVCVHQRRRRSRLTIRTSMMATSRTCNRQQQTSECRHAYARLPRNSYDTLSRV
jgi:hypothetical protein